MVTRFITYEKDPETGSMSVSDITQLKDVDTKRATRRRIMTQLGFIVDKMLEGDYGFDELRVERD